MQFYKGFKHTKETREKMSKTRKGKGLPMATRQKMRIARLGAKNPRWLDNEAGYGAVHTYIKRHNGTAVKCENREKQFLYFKCTAKSNKFHWAKKKGHKYTRYKEDYYQLCISCHRKYDMGTPGFCFGCGISSARASELCKKCYSRDYYLTKIKK